MPLVSAIVRSMDRESLSEALQSVADQTHSSIEIVVVNAKGPGHRALPAQVGQRPLRFVDTGAPLPRSRAANAGLDAAQGDLIFFLDDDDIVFPHHVSTLVDALAAHPTLRGAYAGVRVEFYLDGRLSSTFEQNQAFDRHRLWGRNFLPIHAVLFERSLLALGCRFDESLEVYEDWDFWTQLTQHSDFVHVDRITCCYRNAGLSGFGAEPVESVVNRGKARYFEKWRERWTGPQLQDIVDARENVIGEYQARLLQQQTESAQRAAVLSLEMSALNQRWDELQQRWTQLDAQHNALTLAHQQRGAELQTLQQALAAETALSRAAQLRASGLDDELGRARADLRRIDIALASTRQELAGVYASRSWWLTAPYRLIGNTLRRINTAQRLARTYIANHGSLLGGSLRLVRIGTRVLLTQGPTGVYNAIGHYLARRQAPASAPAVEPPPPPRPTPPRGGPVQIDPVECPALTPHTQPVDIIVCVHNALDDVKACLAAVLRHTAAPYRLILVDDGSAAPTRDLLAEFAQTHGATLVRNETANGYTLAANQGMRLSSSPYLVLLNSDTVVSEDWLDRLVVCAESDTRIGIVGPLSNTASWQSIPEIARGADWSDNPLPPGMSIDDMARIVALTSGQTYPRVGFLNGFCLLIKRAVIERVGLFDEATFARGYGEENDFSLRTASAGFTLAVADDVYVYHAQSKSYSTERRRALSEAAGVALAKKHGQAVIDAGVHVCRFGRTMEGIRVHAGQLFERHALTQRGRSLWQGKRVLFVLPVKEAGGGANIVVSEARAMRRMGVDVQLLNFSEARARFEAGYPGLEIPVVYAADESGVAGLCEDFDAVVATMNTSVFWIAPLLQGRDRPPVLGYYVQDFEPQFYPPDSPDRQTALRSYVAVPSMVCVTKTQWNADMVKQHTGRVCTVVGPSYEVDLFVPRERSRPMWPQAPIRITAMVRTHSPRRSPLLTMQVLKAVAEEFQHQVEIVLFGVDPSESMFLELPHDFAWTSAGMLTPQQMAALLNEMDIFVDFSAYQAMGLTALEAMACGVAVVVPQVGGADSFAVHERNALYVDTADAEACLQALRRLVLDHELRQSLQRQASVDVAAHAPERPAARILEALFGANLVNAGGADDLASQEGVAPVEPGLAPRPRTPLQVFHTPVRGRRRITVILDAMDDGARSASQRAAILFGGLLAERRDADLRLVTRDAPAQPLMLAPLLQTAGVTIAGDLQCRFLSIQNPQAELDLLEGELLITEAWWNAESALAAVPPASVVHLLMGDDCRGDADGDERRRCDELLRRTDLLHVVGGQHLQERLVQQGFANLTSAAVVLEASPSIDNPAALDPALAVLAARV